MAKISLKVYDKVKQSRFPTLATGIILAGFLLISGVHTGLIVLLVRSGVSDILSVVLIIAYWVLVSAGFTLITRSQMKKVYEEPMKRIAEAAGKVAGGDFSVYVPPVHTVDEVDYLDVMIGDFNKMVEELGSVEVLKKDFFSNVSHEIKTPIAVISNAAQMLREGMLPEEERQEYYDIICRSAEKLSAMITNILRLNRLEKQKIRPEPEVYDLCGQLGRCALQFEDVWEKKQILFEARMEDRRMIRGDAQLLELVWTNLLSNAFKFTAEGGSVLLRQTAAGTDVTVEVRDNGCGMDEETLKHLFDQFYQGDTSHATEGNGLGLTLVYRIVQMMGGDIAVTGRPGEGAVFVVTLPLGEKEGRDGTKS